MTEMDLAVQEFLVESQENLDQLDRDLLAIEKASGGREALDSIFRTFHTIKGTCGFFDFPRLEALTHAAEGLLSDLREGRLGWGAAMTGVLLDVVDVVRQNLESIGRTGSELTDDHSRLIATLDGLRDQAPETADALPAAREANPDPGAPRSTAPSAPPPTAPSPSMIAAARARARAPSASTSACSTS